MTYALLIYLSAPPSEPIPELEERATIERHRGLQAEAHARRQLHAVARLPGPEEAPVRTVRRRGREHEVTDGPYLETKEWLVGFYLVDCDTEQDALARARTLADGRHVIEVRPVMWRWEP